MEPLHQLMHRLKNSYDRRTPRGAKRTFSHPEEQLAKDRARGTYGEEKNMEPISADNE